MADVSNTSYSGGICSRSVGIEQVPSTLFGITIPNSVVDQVEQILLAVWVDHENARVEKTYYGSIVESVERGFFAVSASDAVQAAVVHLADAVIPDSIAVSDSYVQGTVESDTGWVCDMAPKSATQYVTMKSGIQGASDEPYSLIYFNCQHWAAARQI